MKKHQLQTIAGIRKLLTDRLHTGWAMVDTIKTNLDDVALKPLSADTLKLTAMVTLT